MAKGSLFAFLLLLLCPILWAQQDSIALREVIVSDLSLALFSKTQQKLRLNDSVIACSQGSLTSVLQYNSPIYFKENGNGMVSSASFRGTTAQQTAVVWNGININSQLNGQTDFNTINISNFDDVTVRSGGGSAIYGSSAIGGSVHLNNDLRFGNHFTNEFSAAYGSFETHRERYRIQAADDRYSVNAGITRNDSRNDYDYPNAKKRLSNVNGQFYNSGLDVAAGFKINMTHLVRIYSQLYEGERHFSGSLAAVGKSKYQETNTRNLLEWQSLYPKFTTTLKVAAWSEKYKYFDDAQAAFFTTAQTQSKVLRYEILLPIARKLVANALVENTGTEGNGSDIDRQKRDVSAGALMLRYHFTQNLEAEASLRKEVTHNYDSPLLFSGGMRWQVLRGYALRWNVSRNFRIPTFNDLYWNGSGNPNLNPESAYQAEIGQELQWGGFKLSATAYYADIQNMLRWVPGKNGIWSPQNVASVTAYGTESAIDWRKKSGRRQWQISGTYNYSVSQDAALRNQLTYTPYHKGTASVAYHYRWAGIFCQWLYTGKVYTSTDHAYEVAAYQLVNLGADANIGADDCVKIGLTVMNLCDEAYQSVASRPMPGRNYTINLTFKF